MAFLDLPGLRLHYELAAQPGRPVLVFSNSLGTNLTMWDAQLAQLSAEFTLLRYDTRGHGQSSTPDGPYTIDQLGQDVLALLDYLGLERVNFCGLSMGGLTGQWLGVRATERVERLVLANTAAKIGTADVWNARFGVVRQHGMVPLAAATMERWFTTPFREQHPEHVQPLQAMLAACDPEGYLSNCAAIGDADFREEIASIQTPTLAIYGTHDPVTTEADARFLAEQIPGCATAGLEAAHLSAVEQPEAFASLLRGFLLP
jgi:3-oxoadipate enol-lactonase